MNMRFLRLMVCLGLNALLVPSVFSQADKKSIVVKGNPPAGPFSEQRPDYLHFKEVKITRDGKHRLNFEITLLGNLPPNPKESVSFYVGFDLDKSASTGKVGNTPDFGQDIGFFIYQNQNDPRFIVSSNTVEYKGRTRDIDVTGLKFSGNKIEFSTRSELFGAYDSFKFFLSAKQRIYDHGKLVNETQVNTTPVTEF